MFFTFFLVLILSLFSNVTFLAINSISFKILKQVFQDSCHRCRLIRISIKEHRVCLITATLLSTIFVIYGIANHLVFGICIYYKQSHLSITLNCNNNVTIICSLDTSNTYGHDMISTHMLKICGKLICKPLELIFQSCIKHGKFPNEWKMANVVPVHKKSDKQILKNYRPVSLLLICGKVFEFLIYNSLFEYFIGNDLISPNQSGFKPGDSCTNQLIYITHEIYQSFDDGFEVRSIFLDISKAFDKVWHNGLIHKPK